MNNIERINEILREAYRKIHYLISDSKWDPRAVDKVTAEISKVLINPTGSFEIEAL